VTQNDETPAQPHDDSEQAPRPTAARTEHKFLVTAALTIDDASWRTLYGDDPITPQAAAQWLTFQFINGVQQGVDVFSAIEIPDGTVMNAALIASNNGG
jgi:hypothetical protein